MFKAKSLGNYRTIGSRGLRLAGLLALSLALALQPRVVFSVDPVSTAVKTAGLISLIDELDKLAQDAATAGDQILQNRIEQAITGLQVVLARINESIKNGKADVNDVIDDAMGDASGLLGDLHDDISAIGSFAGTKLNVVMANATALYDKAPLLDADPAVFAVAPSRVNKSAKAVQVRVFGYLPGDLEDDVHVSVGDVELSRITRGSGGSLVFTLPSGLTDQEENLIPVNIKIDKHYGPFDLLWKTHSFDEQILVGKQKPFKCNVATFGENPDYLQTVVAQSEVAFSATTQGGNARPNENRNITARDLFSQTMGPLAADYDAASVRIVDPGAQLLMYGACNGKGPHGQVNVADSGLTLQVKLHAPHLSRSVKTRGLKVKVCDAGGTHAKAIVRPRFLAARRNAQPLMAVGIQDYELGPEGLSIPVDLPPAANWSVHAKCSFHEGAESWSTKTLVLNPANRRAIARAMSARVEIDRLILEPSNPIRLEEKIR